MPGFAEVKAMDMKIDPAAAAQGKDIFMNAGQCAACHGDDGTGGGPAAAGLEPPPRNLSHPAEYKYGSDEKGVY
ncbi:MAG: c-type cytochrome, partial [Planctomycetes bacterium]|nr:c-type cytochrome [Planctomycetota bacterium]